MGTIPVEHRDIKHLFSLFTGTSLPPKTTYDFDSWSSCGEGRSRKEALLIANQFPIDNRHGPVRCD